MLTSSTQTALAVLNDIAYGDISPRSIPNALSAPALSAPALSELLGKLEAYGLIRLLPGRSPGVPIAYELTRSADKITLLDVLEATGEHLNCNHEAHEEMYLRYGQAARRLGIINHMTRSYLSEIKLSEL